MNETFVHMVTVSCYHEALDNSIRYLVCVM